MMLLILPALTAIVAMICAVRPASRRLLWFALAVAAVNIMATPFTSGEWFYQRAETPAFQEAVTKGDFTSFDDMMSRRDPHRLQKTVAVALGLFGSLCLLALVRFRSSRGAVSARISTAVTVLVLLVGAAAIAAIAAIGQLDFRSTPMPSL